MHIHPNVNDPGPEVNPFARLKTYKEVQQARVEAVHDLEMLDRRLDEIIAEQTAPLPVAKAGDAP